MYGPDPRSNAALALVLQKARKNNFPKASIDAAIARGQGRTVAGEMLNPLLEESIVPPSIPVLIDCLTENKARTQQEVRLILKSFGGKPSSTVYLFEKRGQLVIRGNFDVDKVLEAAIDAGAVDVYEEDDTVVVLTEVSALKRVSDSLELSLESTIVESAITWTPAEPVHGSSEVVEQLLLLDSKLKELPAVQGVYSNVRIGQ